MNPWQMAQQIKYALGNVAWADGSAKVVFGPRSVYVFAGQIQEDAIPAGFPFALISIGTGTMDQDHPDLIEQTFSVVSVVDVAGDSMGEHAVIGGARADLGKSPGAGVAEVAERVRYALQAITGIDGAHIILSASSSGSMAALGRGRHLAYDELTLSAWCTSQPVYPAPQQIILTGSTISWTGPHCSSRYDFLRYRVGMKSGSTPPEAPADATEILYTGSDNEVTLAEEPGEGDVYAVWADYDPRGTGSAAYSSSGSELGAYVTT